MFKITTLALLLIGGIAWLRIRWAVSRNRDTSAKLVKDLKSGTINFESLADSLGMSIRNTPIPANRQLSPLSVAAERWTGRKLRDKFMVQHTHIEMETKAVIIGEASCTDINTATGKEMKITYPCWLRMDIDPVAGFARFFSSMPENKDHQYLLEDLSDEIFNQYIS
jgi:hypothetical protein